MRPNWADFAVSALKGRGVDCDSQRGDKAWVSCLSSRYASVDTGGEGDRYEWAEGERLRESHGVRSAPSNWLVATHSTASSPSMRAHSLDSVMSCYTCGLDELQGRTG